ncbi:MULTISPECIES: hypothetical protein [unclassified Streptomyces]|uniref:hypothetical protein n=1 Tax=unclassified Streptomyces TaxID=2593676 RepID=UPI00093A0B60|nr:hypothetical protein [Streptomyces sp. TSRI0281]OKI45327.1 hypothetical protein A6A29_32375 [Streptomyces sp. TSRI0281]
MRVDEVAVAGPPAVPVTPDDEMKRRVAFLLTRSLVAEGISYDLIVTLEEVLGDRPDPAPRTPRLDKLFVRCGLPLRPQRVPGVALLSERDAARITDRFRRATQLLMQVAPYRVAMYPTEELSLLVALRAAEAPHGEALPYLRRYALAILAVLELMGDDA